VSVDVASNRSTSASSRVQVEKRNAKVALLALLLGLTVGGMVIGGLVATACVQQNTGAVQPHAVSQLNALENGHEDGVLTTGGGLSPVLRANEIVLVSESKYLQGLDTVQGTITALDGYMQNPLPLCINNGTLASWYANFEVIGGYTPNDGSICVFQGKEHYQGTIYLSWKYDGAAASCGELWTVNFYVKTDFTLASNQYPQVIGDPMIVTPDHGTIPGKAVDLCITTKWSGCVDTNKQGFTIISAQMSLVLSNTLPIPSPLPVL
jgi:hypothetical protein